MVTLSWKTCITFCSENLLIVFFFPWLHHSTCDILVSQLGIEPGPLQWECTVLTIGLPGNSWSLLRISGFFCPKLPSNLFEHSLVYWSLNIFCYINLQHITFLSYSLGPWKIATEAYKCDYSRSKMSWWKRITWRLLISTYRDSDSVDLRWHLGIY